MSDQEAVVTSPEAYRRYMLRCYDALYTLAALPLAELAALHERAQSLGPILDPTAYRNNARKIDEDREVIHALQAALRALPADHRDQVLILGRIRAARIAAGLDDSGTEETRHARNG